MRSGHATPVLRIRRQAEGRRGRKDGSVFDLAFMTRARAVAVRLRVSF